MSAAIEGVPVLEIDEVESDARVSDCFCSESIFLLKEACRFCLWSLQRQQSYCAMLAIVKLGAVYVPLDTKFPSDRIAFIAQDADLTCFVVKQIW